MMDLLSGAALLVTAFLQGQSQETGRPVLREDDYKAIVEKNIFSPVKPKKAEKVVDKPKETKKSSDPTPVAPKPPIVAAFADFNGEWRALVRDTATSQSKWYKVGETLAGGTIASIEMLKLTIKFASDTKSYRNGEALPMVNGKATIPVKATPAVISMEAMSSVPSGSAENPANPDEVRARLKRERGKKVEDDDSDTGEETPKKNIKKKD